MRNKILKMLQDKRVPIAVIGLGYVGLPLALALAKNFRVIGFDTNQVRIDQMNGGHDPCRELPDYVFENADICFSADAACLKEARFFIVTVPTPIDEHNRPDLSFLMGASATIARFLKEGDVVVYESTVYPGCTEEECLPLLEKASGLRVCTQFKLGYSPERINPGDREHSLRNTVKIISGCDTETLNLMEAVYSTVLDNPPYRASSIKVAEAAKIVENTQRDVNIALMNELAIVFSRMGINTYDVLEAAETKWNFLKFSPGLVGGHCIGVDPYYLMHKASELGYHTHVIGSGRFVNDSMGGYIAKTVVKQVLAMGKSSLESKMLILGTTFKENVTDVRNSKVADIVRELKEYGVAVSVFDPEADPAEVERYYGYRSTRELPRDKYDTIILAVAHREFLHFTEKDFMAMAAPKCIFVDVKGCYRGRIKNLRYWCL